MDQEYNPPLLRERVNFIRSTLMCEAPGADVARSADEPNATGADVSENAQQVEGNGKTLP